jgi:hypothetical protein
MDGHRNIFSGEKQDFYASGIPKFFKKCSTIPYNYQG